MVTQAGDWRIGRGLRRVRFRTVVRIVAGLMAAAGIGALAAVAVSLFVPGPFVESGGSECWQAATWPAWPLRMGACSGRIRP